MADTAALFRACTAGAPGPLLRASSVHQHRKSPFALWCTYHAPPEARDPPSAFLDMLLAQGRAHEERILARDHAGAATLAFESEEEGFRLTLDAMARGVATLAGAPLLYRPEGIGGRADVLVRDESAPSVFGRYHYRVREIKLARNLKPAHRLQGAFYNHLLGRIQGHLPRTFALVNGDGEETLYDHDEAEILAEIAAIRAIRDGARVEPVYGECIWPWERYNDERAIAADDVSLVDGVGPALRGSLVAAGFATVKALAAAREEALAEVAGVGPARRKKLPVVARAVASGTHVPLGAVRFDAAPVEIFLDLEGIGEQVGVEDAEPMDYLIGALVRRDGSETYVPFVAETLDAEGDMMRRFVSWLATLPPYVLYHWHHYEATHLKKLAERHGLVAEWNARVRPHLRDLHKDATGAFAFPTYGTSLKKIAPYMGFRWRHKEVNAMESIALYLEYAADPAAKRDKLQLVLDYNEDDCIATRVVKDWLIAHATPRTPA